MLRGIKGADVEIERHAGCVIDAGHVVVAHGRVHVQRANGLVKHLGGDGFHEVFNSLDGHASVVKKPACGGLGIRNGCRWLVRWLGQTVASPSFS